MTDPHRTRISERRPPSAEVARVLQNVVEERDLDLSDHEGRVARLALRIAPELGLPDEETTALVEAAHLHDVGKLALPETMLRKPRSLIESEWELMRRHTLVGEAILRALGALDRTADFVRSSHERFDGDGYPDGLAGEQIPLGARTIAVCDAYDAMTSKRPYRAGPSSDAAAVRELQRSAGAQFDPEVVEALCGLPAAARSGGADPE